MTIQIKKSFKKTLLFFAFSSLFGFISEKSTAQAPRLPGRNSDSMTYVDPNNPTRSQMADPDTVKGKAGHITPAQLKTIVGNDKPVSKDSRGRQIYQDANNKQYYVNNKGVKIYTK